MIRETGMVFEQELYQQFALLTTPSEPLQGLLALLRQAAENWQQVLNSSAQEAVQESRLVGDDAAWKQLEDALTAAPQAAEHSLMLLAMLQTLVDKSGQFYQQAALNAPYPAERLFYSSLAQCKQIQKKKVERLQRVAANHIWGKVGFAPLVLGKD